MGDTSLSAHGQIKVAVDYQENIAAGLQILETTWNQLYTDGILANNGDPRYLENWYYAAWAYNSGIEPTGSYDPTGCTAGSSCTGPDGTWGLGGRTTRKTQCIRRTATRICRTRMRMRRIRGAGLIRNA
ncbi:hypothetical protein [Amycolatopsis sp. GM8]|uniref:hypothetical protein n=1 Tax=Amycolatopsis sp. GM8 TaxID=2896530 RepID=UPI001F3776FE|nr:hypothetical protein [Amycolatopsis sp. GM8]